MGKGLYMKEIIQKESEEIKSQCGYVHHACTLIVNVLHQNGDICLNDFWWFLSILIIQAYRQLVSRKCALQMSPIKLLWTSQNIFFFSVLWQLWDHCLVLEFNTSRKYRSVRLHGLDYCMLSHKMQNFPWDQLTDNSCRHNFVWRHYFFLA